MVDFRKRNGQETLTGARLPSTHIKSVRTRQNSTCLRSQALGKLSQVDPKFMEALPRVLSEFKASLDNLRRSNLKIHNGDDNGGGGDEDVPW